MTSNFSGRAVRRGHSNGNNSTALHLNTLVGKVPRSQVNADPRTETSMRTQIAREDTVMENAEYSALIKSLRTETTTSSPHFQDHAEFNVADYNNGAGNGISAARNPTAIINSYEKTQDSSQNRQSLNSFPAGNSPLYMLGTSDGVPNNNYDMDEVTAMTRRYGVFPFIRKTARPSIGFDGVTANMCFYNYQLSHLLGQHLTSPLPKLTDPTGTDQIPDVPMIQAPTKNITLVLDIDGTLIHSSPKETSADYSFLMLSGAKEYTMYVKKRPYVDTFLKKVSEMFNIVVFTASLSSYADQLLDILDPNRLISRRYYRESCLTADGKYIKDLTIIEANLAKVAIIDNTPEVFQLQVNNGIPINTWSSDPYDTSLLELIPFLEILSAAKDVRPIIANKFVIGCSTIKLLRNY